MMMVLMIVRVTFVMIVIMIMIMVVVMVVMIMRPVLMLMQRPGHAFGQRERTSNFTRFHVQDTSRINL